MPNADACCIVSLMTNAVTYTISNNTVVDTISGEPVSAVFDSRDQALACLDACESLPRDEQRKLRAGKRPAPGCDWLIPMAR